MTRRSRTACYAVAAFGLVALLAQGCSTAGSAPNQRRLVLLYDEFREVALQRRWARAEALYVQLSALPLPEDLSQALAYHGALIAYDASDWRTASSRCEAALATDPKSPWRPSLYELWGRSAERLGQREVAMKAYSLADLPSTRIRARSLMQASAP